MNLKAQRIAVAEACPNLFQIAKESGDLIWIRDGCEQDCDPLSDLNAMRAVENTLDDAQYIEYEWILKGVCENSNYSRIASALPHHRLQAFLKTIGKWVEE